MNEIVSIARASEIYVVHYRFLWLVDNLKRRKNGNYGKGIGARFSKHIQNAFRISTIDCLIFYFEPITPSSLLGSSVVFHNSVRFDLSYEAHAIRFFGLLERILKKWIKLNKSEHKRQSFRLKDV